MTETIFTTETPGATSNDAHSPRVLGVDFTVAVAGTITAVRYYVPGPSRPTTVLGSIWNAGNTSASLANGTASPSVNGWLRIPLDTPQAVAPGTTYTASAWLSLSGASQPDYGFTGGVLASDIVSGNLTALAHTGRFLNDQSAPAAPAVYPSGGSGDFNFFVDVEFTAGGTSVQGTLSAALGGITATITGGRRVNASLSAALGGLVSRITGVTSGSATPTNPGGGWYKLLSIFRQQDEDARWSTERRIDPIACPHCGLLLKSGPEGSGVRLYCPAGDFQLS